VLCGDGNADPGSCTAGGPGRIRNLQATPGAGSGTCRWLSWLDGSLLERLGVGVADHAHGIAARPSEVGDLASVADADDDALAPVREVGLPERRVARRELDDLARSIHADLRLRSGPIEDEAREPVAARSGPRDKSICHLGYAPAMALLDLTGRVALVTGGGTRVGAAIVRALAAAGCDALIHYASNAGGARELAADVARLGRKASLLQADLTDRAQIDRLADEASRSLVRLDVLVHNAGNFERTPPTELSAGAWDRSLALNVTAPYLLTLALAPALREAKGSVVAVTCISADRPWKNYIPYSVSKAALADLVQGLALGLAPEVRVNAVAPGTVMPPSDYAEDKLDRMSAHIPLQRLGSAEDVARAVVFLAENDYLTGQTITVDGGRKLL
jgi:pteridine reductase